MITPESGSFASLAIEPLNCMFGAPRGIRTPNRQIRSLVTLEPLARTIWRPLRFGGADPSNTRVGGAHVSRIRRSDPGCRGATRNPGADPRHQVQSWLHVEDRLAARLVMRTPATRP